MIQRLTGQLPIWARADHPVLRYELGKAPRLSARARYLRALAVVLSGVTLLFLGYLVATGLLSHTPGQNLTEAAMAILFWPVLGFQVLARVSAFTMTAGSINEEERRQNWDSLRATESGTVLTMRARWAAVFYRLRGLLGVLLGVRILLILGILWDLTAFQGRYLDLLISGIIPDVPLALAVLLLSFLMTGVLLLPFTGMGFDAALGLWLSVAVRQRAYNLMLQAVIILVRIALVAVLVIGVTQFVQGQWQLSDAAAWLLIGAFAALGDWGLAFLSLGFYGEIWATIPFGILLGLVLLFFALAQAVITDRILVRVIHLAERQG